MKNVSKFIEEKLPGKLLSYLPHLFREGHNLAESIIKQQPCLAAPSVQQGDIRNAAVEFCIKNHLEQHGYNGWTQAYPYFNKPTGRYFEIASDDVAITISHVKYAAETPRKAVFREIADKENISFLFDYMEQERLMKLAAQRKPHLLITYGDQKLEFLQIGMVHPNKPTWMENPVDLLSRTMSLHTDNENAATDVEGADTTLSMEIKQFNEHLRRRGQAG